jgi:hypothetical protein
MSKRYTAVLAALAIAAAAWVGESAVVADANVLTQHNDNQRSGVNLAETKLRIADVKTHFGKLCYRLVNGNIYAQPLYVSGVNVMGKTHVVLVATEHNKVYAFDADNVAPDPAGTPPGGSAALLWQTADGALGPPVRSEVLSNDIGAGNGCVDLTTEVGITATPVIDPTSTPPLVYVVAKSKAATGPPGTGEEGKYACTIYALNLQTGAIVRQTPVQGDAPGTDGDSVGGRIAFRPMRQLNRPGLLLDQGILYVAFGGHCDKEPYHGWLFAYDAATLTRRAIFLTTPDKDPRNKNQGFSGEGGVWMSGQGPSADSSGNIYISIGNGTYTDDHGVLKDSGNSVLKLQLGAGGFSVADWFSPSNRNELDDHDVDLGSAGVLLLANSRLLLAGGKEGKFHLLDTTNMGKSTGNAVKSFQVTRPPVNVGGGGGRRYWNIHGTPIAWDGPQGRLVFICGEEEPVKAFRLMKDTSAVGWKFEATTPLAFSNETAPYPGAPGARTGVTDPKFKVVMPGGFLTLSANMADTHPEQTAILWAAMPLAQSANQQVVEGVLRAFDASNFTKRADGTNRIVQIWSSDAKPNDNLGMHGKFCAPTVADGRVFLPAFNEEVIGGDGVHRLKAGGRLAALVVYGLQ